VNSRTVSFERGDCHLYCHRGRPLGWTLMTVGEVIASRGTTLQNSAQNWFILTLYIPFPMLKIPTFIPTEWEKKMINLQRLQPHPIHHYSNALPQMPKLPRQRLYLGLFCFIKGWFHLFLVYLTLFSKIIIRFYWSLYPPSCTIHR